MTKSYTPASIDDLIIYRFAIFDGKVDKATDSNGLSDPYVKIFAVRNNSKDNESKELLFKTSVCKKTLSPSWNVQQYVAISGTDKIEAVNVELWDQDLLRDEFIGSTKTYIGENVILSDKPYTKPVADYKMFAIENTVYDDKVNRMGHVNLTIYRLDKDVENMGKCINLNFKN